MIDPIRVIEHVTLTTPFGIRFWDEVTGMAVNDGLSITAYIASSAKDDLYRQVQIIPDQRKVVSIRAPRVQAFPNRQGVYVLRNLPGLRSAENGEGDANYWASVSKRSFVIEIVDAYRRFQPFSFLADLPAKGLFSLDCGPVSSPLDATNPLVPLYSSPARRVPGDIAVLRADLWDLEANTPAAWAMLEAHIAGQPPVRGFADLYGHVALIFPYPEPANAVLHSPIAPVGTTTTALTQQEWPVELQAFYTRLSLVPTIPDMCATLTQQAATLWVDSTLSKPLTGGTLKFGQELVLRSQDPTRPSVLLITPAASPP